MKQFGFLRETKEMADKAGNDVNTGICRTGLEEYLEIIFPNVADWVHDKAFGITNDGSISRRRPDYRSESLKLIIEFDGLQHYNNPENILKDIENTKFYIEQGYKVVRIPYFIQLTNSAVESMFGVKVEQKLFDNNVASLSYKNKNTPAYLCPLGIKRMVKEFKEHPEQYEINVNQLIAEDNPELTGVDNLIDEYFRLCSL